MPTSQIALGLVCVAVLATGQPVCAQQERIEALGGVLMTIPAAGGEPQPLVEAPGWSCGSPQWSPDGKWVAYDMLPAQQEDTVSQFGHSTVMAVRSDGSRKVRLGRGGMPIWSPDGASLAWHTYSPSGIVVATFERGLENKPGIEQVVDHWGNPVWLSDPRYLVSIRGGTLAKCDLHTGIESVFLRAKRRLAHGYSIAPSGNRVAYRTYDGDLVLAEVGQDTSADEIVLAAGGAEYSSWAPDSRQIVFAWKRPSTQRSRLYTVDVGVRRTDNLQPAATLDNATPIQGQDPRVNSYSPDWSHDGKWIVFVVFR